MSKRIPAVYKATLGENLAKWYRKFGKVAARRPYHEDEEGTGEGAPQASPFEGHPYLMEVPIGAPSDLASILIADERTLEEADKRTDELTNELQNRLAMQLGKKYKKEFGYTPKPQPL